MQEQIDKRNYSILEETDMTTLTVRPIRRNHWSDFDRLFEGLIPSFWTGFDSNGKVGPRMNVRDTKDHLILTFELPGFDKANIKVAVRDDLLTVTANSEEGKARSEPKDTESVCREFRSGSFSRTVTLPDGINTEKVSADYKNGLLEIKLEKLEEVKPKEIEVKIN